MQDALNAKQYRKQNDDFKLIFGYDFIRQNLRCMFEVMMDSKGAKLEYDTFEIKQESIWTKMVVAI